MIRRGFLVLLVASAVGALVVLDPRSRGGGGASAEPLAAPALLPDTAAAVRADSAWIRRAIRGDGAIATGTDHRLVWPYLANFAAMGLARGHLAGDAFAADAAWRWLEWYQAHQDASGYVTDYKAVGGALRSTGTMDSTDAYAGTYLLAVHDTYAATRDRARLERVRHGVGRAVDAILSTQDADGLTWARPDFRVKYLMDQAEVYAGLRAAVELGMELGDRSLVRRAGRAAYRVYAGVRHLWNPATASYDWAVHEDGSRTATDWSVLFPDALQQVWAVAFGLEDGGRGPALVDRFVSAQPAWSDPDAVVHGRDGEPRDVRYRVPAAWAMARVGLDVAAPVASIRRAAAESDRSWPYTTADAGQLVVLSSPGLSVHPRWGGLSQRLPAR